MFNFLNFFRSLPGLFVNNKKRGYDFSLKRLLLRIFLLVAVIVVVTINHIFMLLDELLLFFYRFTVIRRPIMIIGVPRTGTTLLFRTLAEDKANFTCFTFSEIVFAPSLIQKYIFYSIYWLDKLAGGPLKKCLLVLEERTRSEHSKIHFLGYFKPEEDEFMLLNIYSSVVLKYFFPGSTVFDKYIEFDEKVSPWEKRNIFNFQRRCIKKHLFFWKTIHGREKIFLSKNPFYTPKINTLLEHYPDLRVIVTTRNLEQAIPSFVSMNASVLRSLHSTKLVYPDAAAGRDVVIAWEKQLLLKIKLRPPGQIYECRYGDLTRDIEELAGNIYSHFGIPLSQSFQNVLTSKLAEQRLYRSEHKYDSKEVHKTFGGA